MSANFAPSMSPDELQLLIDHVPRNGICLEFGSGGSSQLFFEHGVDRLYSVESDNAWIIKLLDNPTLNKNKKQGTWIPIHADIGETKSWGKPVAESPDIEWLNYHQYCWEKIPEKRFDLILIDGRFRVACACQCLLRCETKPTTFVIHDFWNRPHYHVLLKYFDEESSADSLVILRPKKRIRWQYLAMLLQKHMLDSR